MVRFPELKYLNFIHKKKKKKYPNFLHRGLKKRVEYGIYYDQILANKIRNDYLSKKLLIKIILYNSLKMMVNTCQKK